MISEPIPVAVVTPKTAYAVFCGQIDQANGQKFVNFLSLAFNDKYEEIHILFQTAGGFVGDGLFLHHLFKSVPVKLALYNGGQISSAGVIAYLGANVRKTNQFATFMVHNSTNSALMSDASKLATITKGLVMDDQRTQAVMKQFVKMPDALWSEMGLHGLFLSADDAVRYGLATAIGDFAPPLGTRVFNVTP